MALQLFAISILLFSLALQLRGIHMAIKEQTELLRSALEE